MLTIGLVFNNFKFILGSTLFAHLQNQHSILSNFYIFRLQPFQNETQNERLYIVITWLVKANHSISIQQLSKFNLDTTLFDHLQNQHSNCLIFRLQSSQHKTQINVFIVSIFGYIKLFGEIGTFHCLYN